MYHIVDIVYHNKFVSREVGVKLLKKKKREGKGEIKESSDKQICEN